MQAKIAHDTQYMYLIAYTDPNIWGFGDPQRIDFIFGRDGLRASHFAMCRRSVLALLFRKESKARTLRLHRPVKAGPAAHFDRNESYACFGDRTLTQQNTCYFQHRALDFSNESPCRDYRSQTKGN